MTLRTMSGAIAPKTGWSTATWATDFNNKEWYYDFVDLAQWGRKYTKNENEVKGTRATEPSKRSGTGSI
jgi:hypothetical protein